MWTDILGGILKNGTTTPPQIQPDKSQQQTEILLYVVVAVLIISIAWVSITLLKKK